MTSTSARALTLILTLAAAAGAAGAATGDGLWLHVRVDEAGGAKVTVNLPLALIEKALPMIPGDHARHLRFDRHDLDADLADLRAMWSEVRDGPDMTFVTVEEDDERVRVWKEKGHVFVEVRGRDDGERVDVRLPVPVVDAFLAGDELDFEAAIRALADHGGGEIVEVRDDADHVRVWIDDRAESR